MQRVMFENTFKKIIKNRQKQAIEFMKISTFQLALDAP